MSRLVVLSETDTLGYLLSHSIKPSEFYTDFDMFKNRAVTFSDVKVICIFAGTCRFSKRLVLELCAILRARIENTSDSAIKDLILLSDTVLPTCDSYYMYSNTPLFAVPFKNWKAIGGTQELKDILGDYEPSTLCERYLLDSDFGCNHKALDTVREISHKDAELISLIKVPDLEN